MEIAPKDLIEKLEFDKILEILIEKCYGEAGKEKMQNPFFHTKKLMLDRILAEVIEAKIASDEGHPIPIGFYPNLKEEFHFLSIHGSVLSEEQFFKFAQSLRVVYRLYQFFKTDKQEAYPHLYDILKAYVFQDDLLHKINKIVDEEGKIKSDASIELMRIRKLQISKRKELDRVFRTLLNQYKQKGMLKDMEEAFRNGRRVLAVPAENKRQIRGIIHDESATGKTVFIEPDGVITINNDIFNLFNDEKREIYNILRDLSEYLRPHLDHLKIYQTLLVRFDIIQAKSRLAKELNAIVPELKDEPFIGIRTGYHPLLFLKNKKEEKPIVPFNLELRNQNRILILSGPNAGGKSICLKSLGLLQLMLQSGIPVPVEEGSVMGLFEKIFLDMGDQQSLEDELSTYSSRLKNMRHFLANSDKNTLVLIDEFGSGTDPKIGGAIAEAILSQLNKIKVFGLITTHYSNLKMFAYKRKGIVNGSMTFDKETLSPTYALNVGKPGSSYAYEIAEKTGLPKEIINYAKHKTGENAKAVDQLLVDLQSEKKDLTDKLAHLQSKQDKLERLIKAYEEMSADLDIRRKKLRLDIKEHNLQDQTRANKQLEKLIREIKEEKNLDKAKKLLEKTKVNRKTLHSEIKDLDENIYKKEEKKLGKTGPIEAGDYVRLRSGGEIAVVESVRKNNAIITVNNLKMTVKVRDLVHANEPVTAPVKGKIEMDTVAKTANFVNKLDVRGMRREEAIKMVEVFVDEALMANGSYLEIIHGKGDGILRKAVKQKLREYPQIIAVRHGEQERGGDGITLVDL